MQGGEEAMLLKEKTEKPENTEKPVLFGSTAKYSIVPRFWKDPAEIEALFIVGSVNRKTGTAYINFVMPDGRIGQIREEDVGILIHNTPTEDDYNHLKRLKKEADKNTTTDKIEETPMYVG